MSPTSLLAIALVASSISFAVALIRLWRKKLREGTNVEEPPDKPRRAIPISVDATTSLFTPPSQWLSPPSPAAPAVWARAIDGEPQLWLCREGDVAWSVTWRTPWRRHLPKTLTWSTTGEPEEEASLQLSPGLWTHWQDAATDAPPTLALDESLWRTAELFGLRPKLIRGQESVALRVPLSAIRSSFDVSCLVSLAATIEHRVTSGELPPDGACGPTAMVLEDLLYGDVAPFGRLRVDAQSGAVLFSALGRRRPEDALLDVWPWTQQIAQAERSGDVVQVRLADGRQATLRALDRDTARLATWLTENC